MSVQFITAEEAREKAMNYSNVEEICSHIEMAAKRGLYKTRFIFISENDQDKLKELGYSITEDDDYKMPFIVSWKYKQ
ncbi:hypothetical protein AAE250_16155 [Bacteroides sp. GD17]|jgi:hypothetical protein|uniref:hypothetical protein n=1 Tax=Bacteroides sp. GD17 TaxID=3139826 RepID=UPI00206DD2CD|nr:hypothetical protein [uncultured Bacteroides sp.]DAV67242.1 MAG TPA: hypothetical protein [Caudoviricetes sp.]